MFGGISSNCFDLAYALSKRGILTTVFSGWPSRKMIIEEFNDYLKIVRLPYLDCPPRYLFFQAQNFKLFSNLLKEYDVIHGVNPLSSSFIFLLIKRLKKPLITSIHEVYLRDVSAFFNSPLSEWSCGDFFMHVVGYPLNEFLVRTCLKASDHIVVCGHSALNDMLKVYRNLTLDKISVIYNGINFDKIKAPNKNASYEGDSITFFGRLIWRKGLIYLIKALSILKERFPYLTLQIFGRGPLEWKIKKLSTDLGIANRIAIHGQVSYERLIENVRKSAVVVLPSLYEVGPFISALEAMACKKPVITFDFPFTREFISNMSTGILAKPGDVKDLAEKIDLLLSNKNLREKLSYNAYNYVKRNHDWNKLVDAYLEVYRSLLKYKF
jgi:glycosyltransferase involved in cell wall biosynthesis